MSAKPYLLLHGDCLEQMRAIRDASVDAVVTDPPYFKVKGEAWDRAWAKPEEFLAWLAQVTDECARVLKPNGSLWMFASPRMAARVEVMVAGRLNVLTHVTWRKPPHSTKAEMFRKADLRAPFPSSERIIFAEHYGADSTALGGSGYGAKCDELRGFVFEPLRAYLDEERKRAGLSPRECNAALGNQMAGHYFTRSQWTLPTRANYEKLRAAFNANGGQYLRREYEYLRREYEDLRRPFNATPDQPYTDVWDYPTVQAYPGKHPCEKPLDMMRHIIRLSTRPGSVVLDPFMGSGSTGVAATMEGRRFVGVDADAAWVRRTRERIEEAAAQPDLFAEAS